MDSSLNGHGLNTSPILLGIPPLAGLVAATVKRHRWSAMVTGWTGLAVLVGLEMCTAVYAWIRLG